MVRIKHPPPPPAPPRQEPSLPPPPTKPAPQQKVAVSLRRDTSFEAPRSRHAALRQWSAQSSGMPSTGLLTPLGNGERSLVSQPSFFGGTESTLASGQVNRSVVARGLPGAEAYAGLETRVQAATDAQGRVDDLELRLADDLALLGPTLTPEERNTYIESFRAQHAQAYADRDAAVGAVAEYLEAEGANIEAYLEAHHGASQYTTSAAAQPLLEGLKMVADSQHAATAVDFLGEHGLLLRNVAGGAGYDLERDVYGPAITATLSHAMASGQTSAQAVESVRTLIDQMPASVQQRVLGSNPDAALGALARVASGDLTAITELSQLAADLETPGAGALVSAALSMAMLDQPERFQSPDLLRSLIAPLSGGSMAATVVGKSLSVVGGVLQHATGLLGSRAANLATDAAELSRLAGRVGPALGAMASTLTVLQLLTQDDPNAGTYIQAGAQALGAAFSAAAAFGVITGVPLAVTVGVFVVTALGGALEDRINREEVRRETIARVTRMGISDAETRVDLVMKHPGQVRDLAALGVDYQRMADLISRGLTDTASVLALAQDFDMSPDEVDRLLNTLAPEGRSSQAAPDLFYFMQFYQQARVALPTGTREQLVDWMRENRPPPTHGGVGYAITGTMLGLLDSMS